MMSYIREYIRSTLYSGRSTQTFFEEGSPGEGLFYDPEEVWKSAMDLVESLNVDLTIDKDLRFFALDESGEVAGAAFVSCNDSKFGFEIVVDSNFSYLREDLICDCLEEYDYFQHSNSKLLMEVSSPEMIETLKGFGFRILDKDSKLMRE